jgi:hypothetical protein
LGKNASHLWVQKLKIGAVIAAAFLIELKVRLVELEMVLYGKGKVGNYMNRYFRWEDDDDYILGTTYVETENGYATR